MLLAQPPDDDDPLGEDQRLLDGAALDGEELSQIRAAIENEIRLRAGANQQAENRAAAGLDRVSTELRRIATGQQALFAFVDTLAKTMLTCLPEPSGEVYQQAVARARVRYDRFLKSVGSSLSGESGKAFAELADRVDR